MRIIKLSTKIINPGSVENQTLEHKMKWKVRKRGKFFKQFASNED